VVRLDVIARRGRGVVHARGVDAMREERHDVVV
jgi:hypothetical protein